MKTIVSIAAAAFTAALAADARLDIFDGVQLAGWHEKSFAGHTAYDLVNTDGRRVLRAVSRDTASGMYRKIDVDLIRTPILHWTWRVDHALSGNDETTKAGDDYSARVYVVVSGGLFFWKTRAINYVWSGSRPVGSTWPNAFTGNAHMIAVNSGNSDAGKWVEQRHDIRADFRQFFGMNITRLDAVAIMTDTDNTHSQATAYYGPIYFSAE